MLLLGKIFSLIGAVLFIIAGIISFVQAPNAGDTNAQATLIAQGVFYCLLAVFSAIEAILIFKLGPAMEALDEDAKRNSIVLIVFGALAGDPFPVLGSIFTLVLNARKGNAAEAE